MLLAAPAAAATLTVAADGSGDYTSVNFAVTAAIAGDTILIKCGSYTEYSSFITIDKTDITIRGESPDKVVLNTGGCGIRIEASNAVIENLTFTGSLIPIVINSTNCVIQNNIINNPQQGIVIQSNSNYILNNLIIAPTTTTGGFYVASTSNFNVIRNNVIIGATGKYSARIDGSSNLIENNTIRDSTYTTVSKGAALYLLSTSNNTIKNNYLLNNPTPGIRLTTVGNDNKIYLNTFYANGQTAAATTPPASLFWDSPSAVDFTYNGTSQLAILGNYWGSDYSGPDADNNGIGDTTYTVPSNLGSDTAPLMGIWQDGVIHGGPDTIKPAAGFMADSFSGQAPLAVTFTSYLVGPGTVTSYAWDFGDGTTSTDKNPSHTYTTGGTYTVNLIVTGPGGSDSVVKTGFITVTSAGADLTVASCTPFFLAHNTQNSVSTSITNSGVTGAGAFKVRFNVDGNSTDVDVASLGAGNSTTVSVGDAVDRRVNDIVPITITMDPESAVAESSETNNVLTTNATVIANGYAGHRWEDKQDLVTNRTFLLHGDTVYSFGDSSYGSKSVTWTASDLPIPEGS
ncbi:MAG: NosD domain-containing protein, partial [Methanoregula sp.]|nr:NosD domain-containing protein [Methanoregula sp.]